VVAPPRITVTFSGERQVSRMLLAPAKASEDLRRPLNTVLDQFEEWIGDQFETEGRTFGTPWAPLRDATVEAKGKAGYSDPGQALVATGALLLSLQGGPGGFRDVDSDSAEFGSHEDTLAYHHGRQRSATNPVPRRPVFELDEAKRRWVMDVLHRGVFRDAGGYVRDRGGRFAAFGL
jgi:hypothetical protein